MTRALLTRTALTAVPVVVRAPARRVGPAAPRFALVAAAAGLLAVLGGALVVGGGAPGAAAPGLPDAGPLTGWGLPAAQLITRLSSLAAVGSLLFAAVLTPGCDWGAAPRRGAMRTATWCALAWASSAAVAGILSVSNAFGAPVSDLTLPMLAVFAGTASGKVTMLVVVTTVVVGLLARRARRTDLALVLLVISLGAVTLPAVFASHSSSAENHALAVTSLGAHVVSATVWVGGLVALAAHGRGSVVLPRAAERYSSIALACFVATGASGLLSAWILLGSSGDGVRAAFGTGYGWLLAGKAIALVSLGGFGYWHRRATLRRLRGGSRRAFLRLAVVEVVVMAATVAIAVALSSSPPPAATSAPVPAAQVPAAPSSVGGAPPPTGGSAASASPSTADMSGHDHGELSVGVLIDDSRFHVAKAVSPGQFVTVYNQSTTDVTITADDGSFDAVVPGQTFITFTAPDAPGSYRFSSRHSPEFSDVLVVR